MKRICPLLLMLLLVNACNGQNKADLSKNETRTQTAYNGTSDIFRCSLRDKAGNLWFGTTGQGLFRYNGKSFTGYTQKEGLYNNYVCSIAADTAGNIWLGTQNGIYLYDGKKFTAIPGPPLTGNINNWSRPQNTSAFPDQKTVFALLADKAGTIWLSIGNSGVYRYDGSTFIPVSFSSDAKKTSNHTIKCISEDKQGNLWFGSWSGDGVYRLRSDRVNHPCNTNTCQHNLQNVEELNRHQEERTQSFTHFTGKDGLTDDMISCILEDKAGNIWLGTRDHGVCRYDGKTFTGFAEPDGLPNCVSAIAEDSKGNIWMGHDGQNGNDGQGVTRYDGKTFTHFTKKDGLSNNNVLSIIEDQSGKLWFGTRFGGLCCYNGQSFTDFTGKVRP